MVRRMSAADAATGAAAAGKTMNFRQLETGNGRIRRLSGEMNAADKPPIKQRGSAFA
jgi:hypothetical protein